MKSIIKIFMVLVLHILCLQLSAQAGRIMNADGKTDTYKLIESYGYGIEVPDCGHPIKHITQVYDNDLKKWVFAFTLHIDLDDDRCGAQDRQRAEIKTFGVSPESMKGHRGKTHQYKWKFKLDKDFKPAPNFCHIHQVKADAGPNAGAPIITLTPRLKGDKEVLQYHVVTKENKSTILSEIDLDLVKGEWVEATETVLHDRSGSVEMELKRLSDGTILFRAKRDNVDLWRDGARFNRPKYGIYRSLKDRDQRRDESVLYTDIEFIEVSDKDSKREKAGWEQATEVENTLRALASSWKTFNVINFGAIGDNVYDCSPAFEKTLQTCGKFGGGTVIVPKGTYRMDKSLDLPSNIHLQFEDGAVLAFSPDIPTSYLISCGDVENVLLSGKGRIMGNGQGINLLNSKNILIENWDIDSRGNILSIKSEKVCRDIIIRNTYFRRTANSAIIIDSNTSGEIRNVFVENNTFGEVPVHIVHLKSGNNRGGTIEDIWMKNNNSEGYLCQTAFRIDQADGKIPQNGASTPVLWYNYYENFTNLNAADKGIYLNAIPQSRSPIESVWFKDIQISGVKETLVKNTNRDIYIKNVSTKPVTLFDAAASTVPGARLDYKQGEAPELWSVATAQSTMARWPDYTKAYFNAWTYVNSYMACGFERLYKDTGDKTYLEYIKRYIDNFIDKDGNFIAVANEKGIVRAPNVCDNLDNMMPGNSLVMLYEHYKDKRYKKAADYILHCMKNYPGNNDGGFWHSRGMHGQMWIDGIFMGQMFLLRYGRSIGDSKYAYDEAIRQITAYAKRGERGNSGLYVHGIYEAGHGNRECRWATAENPQSSDVWGEGLGWYALVLVEALETIPPKHKGYNELKDIYIRLAKGLKNTQDPKTGGWYQVVDKGDQPDNWIETSGSAMFTYAIQQGINLGILKKEDYSEVVKNGYNAIVNHAKINERGLVDIYEACDGLGVQTSYEKYINYRKSLNAKEAYVGFLWATEIVERDTIKKSKR
ncbi:rhamnogalacturonyl hydrolase YesR [Dysgonomonas sp. PFB1-18]|uniref:glycoside hydrolase family 88 protein n=1 Tax=unclassified Dysgonomonas TaxID=2630389 RepID=UPI002473B403|nr:MULTISPECIES: glycoside hydrolase family 88 protein [unclassified Dysgonomonas]MDH6310971.1 rhamnogalacturonyl hydrolase YesR [Dysgonomonas sp. PF1-14]MDH6340814.1 rhamnogalacturonyl hydrolase YesR [Dysgonomonas sp. PF1-16]MDH6382400.1 rhamnogalacturonyl hydrolase YesR [Dysgonomonas sp. PFB1-18]MDH6399783.1 rhamnogalacturonyl hydrolase YesR [Dysgonomonas sp. PF1-23]